MNKTIVMALCAGIAAMLLGIWSATNLIKTAEVSGVAAEYQVATVLPQPRSLPPLSMVDQDGQDFGLDQLQGHWTVIFMGFTSCGHVCPMTMAKLRAIRDTMQEPVQILFVSVDPGRDTPAVIREYVRGFDAAFSGITGTETEIAQLAEALGAPYFVDSSGDSYVVDHSSAIFIINPDAAFAGVISAPHDTVPVATDLDRLLSAG